MPTYCLFGISTEMISFKIYLKVAVKKIINLALFKLIYHKILSFLKLDFFATSRMSFAYDASILQDGIGAQIQRIISLKAISDELHCAFEPFKISNFDEAVFNDFDHIKKMELINQWENLLVIKTIKHVSKFPITIKFNSSRIFWLYLIRAVSKLTFIHFRVRCAFPGPLIDKSSHIYENCKNYLNRSTTGSTSDDILNIVVHIRRGEAFLSQFRFRFLPFDYYENILSVIIPVLDRNKIKYTSTVLLEKITNPVLSINSDKVARSVLIDPENPNLLRQASGDYLLVDDPLDKLKFPLLASCNIRSNSDAFSDFKEMCRADILVISKSSFSFTAGLLNSKALKIYSNFWHSPPSTWLNSSDIKIDAETRFVDLLSQKPVKDVDFN